MTDADHQQAARVFSWWIVVWILFLGALVLISPSEKRTLQNLAGTLGLQSLLVLLALHLAGKLRQGKGLTGAQGLMWFHIVAWSVVPAVAVGTWGRARGVNPWVLFGLCGSFVALTILAWLRVRRMDVAKEEA